MLCYCCARLSPLQGAVPPRTSCRLPSTNNSCLSWGLYIVSTGLGLIPKTIHCQPHTTNTSSPQLLSSTAILNFVALADHTGLAVRLAVCCCQSAMAAQRALQGSLAAHEPRHGAPFLPHAPLPSHAAASSPLAPPFPLAWVLACAADEVARVAYVILFLVMAMGMLCVSWPPLLGILQVQCWQGLAPWVFVLRLPQQGRSLMDFALGIVVQHYDPPEKSQLMLLRQIWALRLRFPTQWEGGEMPASPMVERGPSLHP